MAISESEKNSIWSQLKSKNLLKAFLSLKTEDEAKAFFRDLMTEKEIGEFDMRWRVANMLDQGLPFTEIEKQTGVTPITITRINRWLKEGCGGYKMMIDRLNDDAKN